jgi:hypothetical protein
VTCGYLLNEGYAASSGVNSRVISIRAGRGRRAKRGRDVTIERGDKSGSSRLISPFVKTACTTRQGEPQDQRLQDLPTIASAIESAGTNARAVEDIRDISLKPVPAWLGSTAPRADRPSHPG